MARLTWSYWKRLVLPNAHAGCVPAPLSREASLGLGLGLGLSLTLGLGLGLGSGLGLGLAG